MRLPPTRWSFPMVMVAALFWGLTPVAHGQTENDISQIQMTDVPITTAIDNLARQARLNFIIDPNLFASPGGANGKGNPEPTMTMTWTNISAQNALDRVLQEHHLVAVKDKFTTVTLFTGIHHVANSVDASLLGGDIQAVGQMTNGLIPLLLFSDAPLDVALDHLIKQDHLNVILDSQVSGYFDKASNTFHNEPTVSLRWENLTARQALVALCEIYDLVIVKDSATGVVSIKPRH
jgi:hypothetical protein